MPSISTINANLKAAEDRLAFFTEAYAQVVDTLQHVRGRMETIALQQGEAEYALAHLQFVKECAEDGAEMAAFCTYEDEDDLQIPVRERKTRAHVLTPAQAVYKNKSSKNHKLPPRSEKRDRTKTKEAKAKTRAIRMSHSA